MVKFHFADGVFLIDLLLNTSFRQSLPVSLCHSWVVGNLQIQNYLSSSLVSKYGIFTLRTRGVLRTYQWIHS